MSAADQLSGPERSPFLTGSLTGFILSRGQPDAPASRRRLVILALVILLVIGVFTAIALVAIGNVFNSILGG